MGQRARKRRQAAAQPPPPATPAPAPRPSRYDRGRERDDAVRAALQPLGPGERPWPATTAAVVAFLLGAANLVALAAQVKINGTHPSPVGVVAFGLVMFAAAAGIWRMRYWAVLGFQALLALIVLVFFLFLLRASSLGAAGIAVAVVAIAGALFWKLIRVMARMQMPERRPGT